MTYPDARKLLDDKVAEHGQAAVARMLGISDSAISQLRKGTYHAAPDQILNRVVEVFGGLTVECSALGEIPLSRCAEERKKPFTPANHQAVRVWKACQTCERRK
jgi:hypothetical protein